MALCLRGSSDYAQRVDGRSAVAQAGIGSKMNSDVGMAGTGRIVLTGGTGAIGRAIALRLLRHSTSMVLLGRPTSARTSTRDLLVRAGARVDEVDVDLSDPTSAALAGDVLAAGEPIRAFVHAAGHNVDGDVVDVTPAQVELAWTVVVRSAYVLSRACIGSVAAGRGSFVYLNSTRIDQSVGGHTAYAMAKASLRVFANGLRDEVSPLGVRVTTLLLGSTASDFQRHRSESLGHDYHPANLLQPEDVAEVVALAIELPRTAEITEMTLRPGIHPSRRTATGPVG